MILVNLFGWYSILTGSDDSGRKFEGRTYFLDYWIPTVWKLFIIEYDGEVLEVWDNIDK